MRSVLFLALLGAAAPAAVPAGPAAATKQPAPAALLDGTEQTRTWELPPGARSLNVNGYDMAYVERGAGQPVLFVHGIFTDFRYFAGALNAFPPNYRVIALSLRHYYPERWDGGGSTFSMRQHVADVAAFIRKLGAGPVHLVGHSRGGSLALYLAKDHAELVRTLTLAEPGMPAFQVTSKAAVTTPRDLIAAAALLDQGKIDEALASLQIGGPGTWQAGPEEYRQMLRDNARTMKGLISDPSDKWDRYTCAHAGRIAAPVLLLGGEKSPPERGKSLDALQSCLKRSERGVVPNVGHAMPRLNPAGFCEAVLAFISKHSRELAK